MKKIWIDTDCGVDDAIALINACHLPLEIIGVSAVAGNQTLDKTFKNTRDVLSLLGKEDIKVYKGSDKPLIKALHIAAHVHGENGLGGAYIDASKAPVEEKDAVDAMHEAIMNNKNDIYLIPVGPLTNIALLLRKHPLDKEYIRGIYIMGGAINKGNVTPYAEFNIYVDPEAAKEVFASGIHIHMFGLNVTHKAYLEKEDMKTIVAYDNPKTKLFKDSTKLMYGLNERVAPGLCLHDSCPILFAVYPEIFKGYDAYVDININQNDERYGETYIIDNKKINATIYEEVDREKVKEIVYASYRN